MCCKLCRPRLQVCLSCFGGINATKTPRPSPNQSCRLIFGCLEPTSVDNLYLLAGITPREIRNETAIKIERSKQLCDSLRMLMQQPALSRLKSRAAFYPV